MGFARDKVEFTMDNIDTEVESVTMKDKSSDILIFRPIRACFWILIDLLRVKIR